MFASSVGGAANNGASAFVVVPFCAACHLLFVVATMAAFRGEFADDGPIAENAENVMMGAQHALDGFRPVSLMGEPERLFDKLGMFV